MNVDFLSKEKIDFIVDKSPNLFIYTLPGIVTLELVFKIGIFTETPSDIYNFIIYSFWIIIFSFPFTFTHYKISNVAHDLLLGFAKIENLDDSKISEFIDLFDENDLITDFKLHIRLGYVIFKTVIFFVLYNLMDGLLNEAYYYGLPLTFWYYVIILVATLSITHFTSGIYAIIYKKFYLNGYSKLH